MHKLREHGLFITGVITLLTMSAVLITLTRPSPITTTSTAPAEDAEIFRFATVGDFGLTDNTRKTLQQTKAQEPDYILALGDMSYGKTDEYSWCNTIKAELGPTAAFQLIAGNHDIESAKYPISQGHIDRFASCLPNRMPSLDGIYGQQYFFDHKSTRTIAIAPDLIINGRTYTYASGTSERRWLEDVLADAKTTNKRWVFVAMHKNCITLGVKKCEISEELFSYLVRQKVSLILQGHEHAYIRSKQLNINKDCPVIPAELFNPACVKQSADNKYKASDGSVLVINGTGGIEVRDLDFARPAKDYFADWHAPNASPTYGPSIVHVFKDKLVVDYVDVNGVVQDSFQVTI
jgi:calcineurin-like phosphoesterase family protein